MRRRLQARQKGAASTSVVLSCRWTGKQAIRPTGTAKIFPAIKPGLSQTHIANPKGGIALTPEESAALGGPNGWGYCYKVVSVREGGYEPLDKPFGCEVLKAGEGCGPFTETVTTSTSVTESNSKSTTTGFNASVSVKKALEWGDVGGTVGWSTATTETFTKSVSSGSSYSRATTCGAPKSAPVGTKRQIVVKYYYISQIVFDDESGATVSSSEIRKPTGWFGCR